jgi:hypothetical protein
MVEWGGSGFEEVRIDQQLLNFKVFSKYLVETKVPKGSNHQGFSADAEDVYCETLDNSLTT